MWFIAKYRFRKISVRLGYSIPINVIGPGFSLPHRGNIIINPNTKIGKNCRIHVGVTIGANATVSKSFTQNNITIAGTPAQIIKTNTSSWNGK